VQFRQFPVASSRHLHGVSGATSFDPERGAHQSSTPRAVHRRRPGSRKQASCLRYRQRLRLAKGRSPPLLRPKDHHTRSSPFRGTRPP
jgi:hypothetical protein